MLNEPDSSNGDKRAQRRPRTLRVFVAILAGVAALASFEFYALWQSKQRALPVAAAVPPPASPTTADTAASIKPAAPAIVGWVDVPAAESFVGDRLVTSGWAIARDGARSVDIRVAGRSYPARTGLARPDVAKKEPASPEAATSGFAFEGDFADLPPDRYVVDYLVTDSRGTTQSLAKKSLISPAAMAMWRPMLDARPALARNRFHFLMMISGIGLGGGAEIDTQYRDYLSRTQKVGISVPILYMRTTHGASGDWRFDPAFDLRHKCGERVVAEDNLASVMKYAVEKRMPVQFILNGGIWGDASCETPQWDLTDHLEEDPANCQWSHNDKVFPDNYLKGLPGSTDSPDLARSLTYNVYAGKVRAYKRRNLQAAAGRVAAFAREHPDLFVGVVLDADTYMNPFFRGKEAYDYNPGMLRQFREWLQASGPYAGAPVDGAPDLRAYRRAKPLTLAMVNAVAHKEWKSWKEVQPPRVGDVVAGEHPIWRHPWWNLWDVFRKHIVDLHYDELSRWAHEAGIPRDAIFSAQGLIQPDPGQPPFAVYVDSPSSNYDSAGVSVQGAIPSHGHLGAILYGRTARNDIVMETGRTLFATIGRMDDRWGIVEYNNTDLTNPTISPDYAMAYKTFRDAFNYGAREISAMAWNGSNGLFVGQPGYVPYTAWRNTPAEEAMRDFLVSHADVPLGARMWTFGTPLHADADGWSAERGAMQSGTGFVTLRPDRDGVSILSPTDQVIRPAQIERLVMRFRGETQPAAVKVHAQLKPDDAWREIGAATGTDVRLRWPAAWLQPQTVVERIKIELTFAPGAGAATLSRVLLYPGERAAIAMR